MRTHCRSNRGVVIVTKRKGLAAAGVVALIAAGSAACGTAQATTPQGKVQNAFTKLADQKSLTVGASFDASADQIYAALSGQDDFTKSDAQLLAGLHAQYAVSSDHPLGEKPADGAADKNTSVGFLVSADPAGKKNLVEVRQVAGTTYLRADIKGLEKLVTSASDDSGVGSGSGSSDSSDAAMLNQLLDGADQLPTSAGGIKAALQGKWISLDPKFLDTLGQFAGSSGSGSSATPGLDATTQAQIVTALKNALAHNVKTKDLGSHDGADHIQVDVPAQQLAKELSTSVAPLLKNVPDFKQSDLDSALKDVPNRTVAADVAIKDGMVSAVTVDMNQFDDTAHTGKVPLAVTFDGGAAKVAAPSDATVLKTQDLVGLFMSGMLPGTNESSSGSGSGSDSGAGSDSLSDLLNSTDLAGI